MLIQGQSIRLDTSMQDLAAKHLRYEFISPEEIHPMTIGIAMLCIAQSIFIDQGHDILEALGIHKMDSDFETEYN